MKNRSFQQLPYSESSAYLSWQVFILDAILEATAKGFASPQNSDLSHLK